MLMKYYIFVWFNNAPHRITRDHTSDWEAYDHAFRDFHYAQHVRVQRAWRVH